MPPTSGTVLITGGDLNGLSTMNDKPSRRKISAAPASSVMGIRYHMGTPRVSANAATLSIVNDGGLRVVWCAGGAMDVEFVELEGKESLKKHPIGRERTVV